MRKSFELCCASAHSHSVTEEIPEVPLARRCLDALKADGKNPDLDELTEAIFQRHGVRLSKAEVARQLDGHRQGHSGTSARAHDASGKAAEASDRVRNMAETDDPAELHACAQTAHEEAARAHMKAWIYHGRAADYHKGKVLNQSAELNEPEDDESAE
jgi:hypothetical protein